MVVIYEPPWQPFLTVTIDCPGKDSLRIWPLPVVDAWNTTIHTTDSFFAQW
jgi:hypothetical protein